MVNDKNRIKKEHYNIVVNYIANNNSILTDQSLIELFHENIDILCNFINKKYNSIDSKILDKIFQNSFIYDCKELANCFIKNGYKRFSHVINDLIESDVEFWSCKEEFKIETLSLIVNSKPKKLSDKLSYGINNLITKVKKNLEENDSVFDKNKTRKEAMKFLQLLNQLCGQKKIILKP
jgi:hypothetical protein